MPEAAANVVRFIREAVVDNGGRAAGQRPGPGPGHCHPADWKLTVKW